jgi:hypothetical protein
LNYASPGGPPTIYTFAEPITLEAMQADIEGLRAEVNVLVVAFHKGIAHTPAALAMYERQVAKAAIEAGADLVIGHHAHIPRGSELYCRPPRDCAAAHFSGMLRRAWIGQDVGPQPKENGFSGTMRKIMSFILVGVSLLAGAAASGKAQAASCAQLAGRRFAHETVIVAATEMTGPVRCKVSGTKAAAT